MLRQGIERKKKEWENEGEEWREKERNYNDFIFQCIKTMILIILLLE